MFDTLFTRASTLTRYRTASCAKSKIKFLNHCAKQGFSRVTLKKYAWVLLVFSESIDLNRSRSITQKEIEFAVDHRIRYKRQSDGVTDPRSSRLLFIHVIKKWLRFSNRLAENKNKAITDFDKRFEKFIKFVRTEHGFSTLTIKSYREKLTNFFKFVGRKKVSISDLTIHDVDAYIARQGKNGWTRSSLHTLAACLRAFFYYAEKQGWVKEIAAAIDSPKIYVQENIPIGPTWEDVKRLIDSFSSENASDLRARAIVLLLAVYGLRRSEVAELRLEDVDWESEILHVTRLKQRHTQQYPLDRAVGDAILRYIKEARPQCKHRKIFLTLDAPIRPLLPECISAIVRNRLKALNIDTPKKGSHCLRHACARHLLSAGFSLKQIGDHLGHSTNSATQVYVKVDLDGLRQVAELDMGDLL